MAFTTLSLVQIIHSFNLKSQQTLFKSDFKSNKFMNYTAILSIFITLFLVVTPAGYIFGLTTLSGSRLVYSILLALSVVPYCEIRKLVNKQIAN